MDYNFLNENNITENNVGNPLTPMFIGYNNIVSKDAYNNSPQLSGQDNLITHHSRLYDDILELNSPLLKQNNFNPNDFDRINLDLGEKCDCCDFCRCPPPCMCKKRKSNLSKSAKKLGLNFATDDSAMYESSCCGTASKFLNEITPSSAFSSTFSSATNNTTNNNKVSCCSTIKANVEIKNTPDVKQGNSVTFETMDVGQVSNVNEESSTKKSCCGKKKNTITNEASDNKKDISNNLSISPQMSSTNYPCYTSMYSLTPPTCDFPFASCSSSPVFTSAGSPNMSSLPTTPLPLSPLNFDGNEQIGTNQAENQYMYSSTSYNDTYDNKVDGINTTSTSTWDTNNYPPVLPDTSNTFAYATSPTNPSCIPSYNSSFDVPSHDNQFSNVAPSLSRQESYINPTNLGQIESVNVGDSISLHDMYDAQSSHYTHSLYNTTTYSCDPTMSIQSSSVSYLDSNNSLTHQLPPAPSNSVSYQSNPPHNSLPPTTLKPLAFNTTSFTNTVPPPGFPMMPIEPPSTLSTLPIPDMDFKGISMGMGQPMPMYDFTKSNLLPPNGTNSMYDPSSYQYQQQILHYEKTILQQQHYYQCQYQTMVQQKNLFDIQKAQMESEIDRLKGISENLESETEKKRLEKDKLSVRVDNLSKKLDCLHDQIIQQQSTYNMLSAKVRTVKNELKTAEMKEKIYSTSSSQNSDKTTSLQSNSSVQFQVDSLSLLPVGSCLGTFRVKEEEYVLIWSGLSVNILQKTAYLKQYHDSTIPPSLTTEPNPNSTMDSNLDIDVQSEITDSLSLSADSHPVTSSSDEHLIDDSKPLHQYDNHDLQVESPDSTDFVEGIDNYSLDVSLSDEHSITLVDGLHMLPEKPIQGLLIDPLSITSTTHSSLTNTSTLPPSTSSTSQLILGDYTDNVILDPKFNYTNSLRYKLHCLAASMADHVGFNREGSTIDVEALEVLSIQFSQLKTIERAERNRLTHESDRMHVLTDDEHSSKQSSENDLILNDPPSSHSDEKSKKPKLYHNTIDDVVCVDVFHKSVEVNVTPSYSSSLIPSISPSTSHSSDSSLSLSISDTDSEYSSDHSDRYGGVRDNTSSMFIPTMTFLPPPFSKPDDHISYKEWISQNEMWMENRQKMMDS